MKKFLPVFISLLVGSVMYTHALVVNEIMSNPVGDDGGREWVEIYNDTDSDVDLSALTISIKGANAVVTTPLQGGTVLSSHNYAIIGSTVSSATKFLQDYPSYSGILFKSSISLVNTGVTSIDIKLNGVTVDSVSSYTAAKEGFTYSKSNGSFVTGNPTPAAENQVAVETETVQTVSNTTTETQATISQTSTPLADIVLYMPLEKTVVAGAPTPFSVFGLTRAGKTIDNVTYSWAYGDGGQGTGSSTIYSYAYPGKYIVQVEGCNGYVSGTGRTSVRVVAPDVKIINIATGKYGAYIDISNENSYDLDFSQWRLVIDGSSFPFPKNTLIAGNGVTHLSGVAMGFASTTISPNSVVQIMFPNQEEVTRYSLSQDISKNTVYQAQPKMVLGVSSSTMLHTEARQQAKVLNIAVATFKKGNQKTETSGTTSKIKTVLATTTPLNTQKERIKDTRIVSFFRSIFSR